MIKKDAVHNPNVKPLSLVTEKPILLEKFKEWLTKVINEKVVLRSKALLHVDGEDTVYVLQVLSILE